MHIADVTHFVKPGSLTDLEGSKRATTVYLADRRYDMLPPVLSAQLCSLLGGVERWVSPGDLSVPRLPRYAVSCIWEVHPQTYRVKEVWYGRTVIKSRYKLCYEHAQVPDLPGGFTLTFAGHHQWQDCCTDEGSGL